MLTIVTPAGNYDLATLASVKLALGISDRASDAKLGELISQISSVIAGHCNRVFPEETIAETFRLKCRQEGLLLARFPIISITSIVENDETLAASDYEISTAGTLERLRSDRVCHWPAGKIVVTYVAGYADIPDPVQRAVIMMVGFYRFRGGADLLKRSEDIPGVMARTMQDYPDDGELPSEVRALLNDYIKPAGS